MGVLSTLDVGSFLLVISNSRITHSDGLCMTDQSRTSSLSMVDDEYQHVRTCTVLGHALSGGRIHTVTHGAGPFASSPGRVSPSHELLPRCSPFIDFCNSQFTIIMRMGVRPKVLVKLVSNARTTKSNWLS